MNGTLTDAQRQAIEKAYSLLGEHFDHAVLGVVTELPAECSETGEAFLCYFKGGFTTAVGITERCKQYLLSTKGVDVQ